LPPPHRRMSGNHERSHTCLISHLLLSHIPAWSRWRSVHRTRFFGHKAALCGLVVLAAADEDDGSHLLAPTTDARKENHRLLSRRNPRSTIEEAYVIRLTEEVAKKSERSSSSSPARRRCGTRRSKRTGSHTRIPGLLGRLRLLTMTTLYPFRHRESAGAPVAIQQRHPVCEDNAMVLRTPRRSKRDRPRGTGQGTGG
jgi:hypothetical protein